MAETRQVLRRQVKTKPDQSGDADLTLVRDAYDEARSWRETNFDSIWNNAYAHWEGYLQEASQTDYPFASEVFDPTTTSTILTILPRLVGRKLRYVFSPQEESDVVKAFLGEHLFSWWWRAASMDQKLIEFCTQMLIYGTGFFKIRWEFVKGDENDPAPRYDGPLPDVVDIKDLFIDPLATSIHDARYVIHRSFVDYEELKNNKSYENVEKLEKDGQASDEYLDRRFQAAGRFAPEIIGKDRRGKIEKLEYWSAKEKKLIVVAGKNSKVVLRPSSKGYPYKSGKLPFIAACDIKRALEVYGKGEPELIDHLQRLLNTTYNQVIDNHNLAINRLFIADKNADINWESLFSAPGNVIQASGGKNAIQDLEIPLITNQAIPLLNFIKSQIATTTGVDDYSRGSESGVPDSTRGTATGIRLIQAAANQRFYLKFVNLEQALKELGWWCLDLFNQYGDRNKIVRIVGEKEMAFINNNPEFFNEEMALSQGKTRTRFQPINETSGTVMVKPQELKFRHEDLDIEITYDQPIDQEIRRAEAMQLYQLLGMNPQLVQQYPNLQEGLLKDLLESYDKKDIESLLAKPPPLPTGLPPGQSPLPEGGQQLGEEDATELMAFRGLSPEEQQQLASQAGLDPQHLAMVNQ